jgi:hypothetical protein
MVQHNLNTYINYKRGWDEQVELTVLGRSDVDESAWADLERNRKARRMPGVNGVGWYGRIFFSWDEMEE